MIVIIVKSKSPTLVRCASGKRGGNCHRKGMYIFWNCKTFANKPLQNSCFLVKITHQLCKFCPFTVNHFRRFSVAANRIFCWLSCRTSDYNTSNNIDSCAKRSIIDPLSVVFSCYLRCITAKTFFLPKKSVYK